MLLLPRSRLIRLAALGSLALALLLLASWFTKRRDVPIQTQIPGSEFTSKVTSPTEQATAPSSPVSTFAESILEDYGNPARPPEDDLRDIARTLDNFALLVKGANPLPLGTNEEIATALRGKSKAKLRALPDTHRAFNAQGQLIDRWGSPLFFHAQSRDRLEIRSAGPDRKMWTEDDLHRMYDGTLLRGEALLAPSFYDAKAIRR